MKLYSIAQVKEIVDGGGTLGIKTLRSTFKAIVSDTEEEYGFSDSSQKWKTLHDLSEIACSDSAWGDSDDYHNLAVDFARHDLHDCAIAVLEKGLLASPYSADLLADMVLYGVESGRIEKSDEAYKRILQLNPSAWGWRAYSFVIGYYIEKAKKVPMGKTQEKYKQKALQTANAFISYAMTRSLGDIDRAYYRLASIYEVFGGKENKIEILKKGFEATELAPQCSLGLADVYFEMGLYKETLQYIERCIIAVNRPQPDINPSYVHLIYSLAKTQQFLDSISKANNDVEKKEIEDIYKHFHIATEAYDASEAFNTVAKQTIKALRIQTGIEDLVGANVDEFF